MKALPPSISWSRSVVGLLVVVAVFQLIGGFAYLMSQRPITRIGQLRAQKMWVPEGDESSRRVMKALDVSAIPLPLTDVLAGLQTGLIDTVASSPVGASRWWPARCLLPLPGSPG